MNKLFFFFVFIILTLQTLANNTIDPDYWARLLQGDTFWDTGSIMKYDPYSYTQTHFWIDHEWGSSVVFSFIQNNFGFLGILISKILLVFLIFFLIFKIVHLQTEKNNNLLNILLFSITVYSLPTITQSGFRCHFFTFLFFTLFLYLLELVRKKDKTKLLYLLPFLMLIWCNMHGGCVSGLGLLGIYTVGEFFNKKPFKKYLLTTLACIGVMFINPYGIDYVKFIFMASTMSRPYITEWISPFIHPVWNFMLWFKILILFYIFILIRNFKTIKNDYTKLILLLVCILVSVRNVKSTPFFIITAFCFLYDSISVFIPEKYPKVIEILSMIFFIAISTFSIKSFFFLSEQPYKVVEFFKVNNLKGKILAPMDMGSYIAYKLYPNNLIYMDGRYEEVYFDETKKMLDDFYNVRENWQDVLNSNPDYIIVPYTALVNDFLIKRKDYKAIWRDDNNMIYISTEKVKPSYKMTSNDLNYYIKTAFNKYEDKQR